MLATFLYSLVYWRKEPEGLYRTLIIAVLTVVWTCGFQSATAQQTIVKGVVLDSVSGEPLGFASVYFQDTQIGMLTDEEGRYSIQAPAKANVDTLICSYFGYELKKYPVRSGLEQNLTIYLVPSSFQIDEVIIVPPAYPIIRKAIDRKAQNDRTKHEFYQMEAYTKVELGLNDLDEKKRNKVWMRTFDRVIDEYLDTTREDLYLKPSRIYTIEKNLNPSVSILKPQKCLVPVTRASQDFWEMQM